MELQRRVRSAAMGVLSSAGYLRAQRARARLRRRLTGGAAAVHYFHQADDPYSHLAAQKLATLQAAYDLPFRAHLVPPPGTDYQGSAEHFQRWAITDAASVADAYGTSFAPRVTPSPAAVRAANAQLTAALGQADFAARAVATGSALWSGAELPEPGHDDAQEGALRTGAGLRRRLGHYLGGMFYFDGEWFWGIDRIRLLEQRLLDEGYGGRGSGIQVPEPVARSLPDGRAGQILLEYFPSLRSPYTAVGHQRVIDLVDRSGVTLKLRPVMPMMMRGVPAPQAKQRYIILDAGREARARGVAFGPMVDPFGEPVKRAFALFPAATELGHGLDFVSAYLSAAWAEGVDITGEAGLAQVAGRAGLDWTQLRDHARDSGSDWQSLLEDNLQSMLASGLWGVPSFRVTGGNDTKPFACWGQDRIWRVADEIARRCAPTQPSVSAGAASPAAPNSL